MRSNIKKTFEACAAQGRAAFVAYVTAGDPDFERSLEVVDRVAKAGADIIELGVPFSDPLADGEANQLAANRALNSGVTPWRVLDLVREIRKLHPELPLVLFTYLNPVAYSGGFGEYCQQAVAAGVDAMLPLDLPPEESCEFRGAFEESGLGLVALVAPTSDGERVNVLANYATSFIYYVCREGVTGERQEFASGVREKIELIKKHADLPVVVGFGISTPKHVAAAADSGADGVVVGSAIVRKVEAMSEGRGDFDDIQNYVASLTKVLRNQ